MLLRRCHQHVSATYRGAGQLLAQNQSRPTRTRGGASDSTSAAAAQHQLELEQGMYLADQFTQLLTLIVTRLPCIEELLCEVSRSDATAASASATASASSNGGSNYRETPLFLIQWLNEFTVDIYQLLTLMLAAQEDKRASVVQSLFTLSNGGESRAPALTARPGIAHGDDRRQRLIHESSLRCIVFVRSLSNYSLEEVLYLGQQQQQGQQGSSSSSSFSSSSLRFIIKDILQSTIDMDRMCAIYAQCCDVLLQGPAPAATSASAHSPGTVLALKSEMAENISIIVYHTVYIALNNLGSVGAAAGHRSASANSNSSLFLKNWYQKSLRECIRLTHALIGDAGPRGQSIDYMPYLVMRNIVDVFKQTFPDDISVHFDGAGDASSSANNNNTNTNNTNRLGYGRSMQ
jgi:hypothetical protein